MPASTARSPYSLDDIVDIAVKVFLDQGYDAASMDDVARAAGIRKSSIYHHVQGKAELLSHGVSRALDALFAVLDEEGAVSGAASERLRYILRRTVEIICARTPEVALLVRLRGATETQREAVERRREFDRSVARLARAAIRDGDLRADLDPNLFTRLAFGMAASITEWYRPGGKADCDQLAAAVDTLIFIGSLTTAR